MERQFETYMGCDASFAQADVVLFGAPFDSTTSNRPGARFGPRAIRQESFGLETYSPWLDLDLADAGIMDAGDLELPFGDCEGAKKQIYAAAAEILKSEKFPFLLGGEHSVSLGAVEAAFETYPQLFLIHFDAHTDLREEYLGVRYSHASVVRRCWDLLGDRRIAQFGIRSGLREEFQWAETHTQLRPFDFSGLSALTADLKERNIPVYFTLDLDVLDPSAFPGTGTPEAGGVTYRELMEAIALVFSADVVGCDVVELAPMLDLSSVSTATACKVVREMLLMITNRR